MKKLISIITCFLVLSVTNITVSAKNNYDIVQPHPYTTDADRWYCANTTVEEVDYGMDTGIKVTFDECYGVLKGFDCISCNYSKPEEIIVVRAGSKMHAKIPEAGIAPDIARNYYGSNYYDELKEETIDFLRGWTLGPAPIGDYLQGICNVDNNGNKQCSILNYKTDTFDNSSKIQDRYMGVYLEEQGNLFDFEDENGIWIKLRSGFTDYHLTFEYDSEAPYPQCIMYRTSAPLKPVLSLTDEQIEELRSNHNDIVTIPYYYGSYDCGERELSYNNRQIITTTEKSEIKGLYNLLFGDDSKQYQFAEIESTKYYKDEYNNLNLNMRLTNTTGSPITNKHIYLACCNIINKQDKSSQNAVIGYYVQEESFSPYEEKKRTITLLNDGNNATGAIFSGGFFNDNYTIDENRDTIFSIVTVQFESEKEFDAFVESLESNNIGFFNSEKDLATNHTWLTSLLKSNP